MIRFGRCALLFVSCALVLTACHAPWHGRARPNAISPASNQSGDPKAAGKPENPSARPSKSAAAAAPIAAGGQGTDDPIKAAPAAKNSGQAALTPAPVPRIEPSSLLGLVGPDLEGRLGVPFMIRQENPAEIWQYRGETCVFDIFLYPEASGRRVVYLEARDKAARQVDKQPCLSEILRARAEAATS